MTKAAPDSARLSRRAGLTLLELLVALSIFAIVGGAIYSTFTTTLAGRDRALHRAEAYAVARGVLDRIENDLRGNLDVGIKGSLLPRLFAPGTDSRFASGHGTGFGDEDLLLELTTVSARGVTAPEGYIANAELAAKLADHGDQAHVLWRIEQQTGQQNPEDARGPVLVRYEVRPPRNEAIDTTRAPRQVVGTNVAVRLEFYDQNQWSDGWDSAGPGNQHDRSPTMVRTTVQLSSADEEPVVLVSSTVLPLTTDKKRSGFAGPPSGDNDKAGKKKDGGKN